MTIVPQSYAQMENDMPDLFTYCDLCCEPTAGKALDHVCPGGDISEYERMILVHDYHRQRKYGYTTLQPIMCYIMHEHNDMLIYSDTLDRLVAKGYYARRHFGPGTFGDCDYTITQKSMDIIHALYYHETQKCLVIDGTAYPVINEQCDCCAGTVGLGGAHDRGCPRA